MKPTLCPRCKRPMKKKGTGLICYRKKCRTKELPMPYAFDLWKHMADNYGLILLDSELDDIVRCVKKMDRLAYPA